MKAVYELTGKAREYSPLAVNLYKGCAYGCKYCFAPATTKTKRSVFHSPDYIRPRPGILKTLKKNAAKLSEDKREILLSFTSDVYQPIEKDLRITRQALEILMAHGLTVTVLTKGGPWGILRDMDLLKMNPSNAWSATLTFDDPAVSRLWEPGAALPGERIEALRIAHAAGINTWVSFEPVIDPETVYRLLDLTHGFVDFYKVGKLNYHPRSKGIDWVGFRERIEAQLKRLGKAYYLKKDLREAKGLSVKNL
jgi:DNA repair photolyase